jgi:O-antigen/teichoic acid export membrane protein
MLRRLVGHITRYSIGSLLVTAAGFISFPFLSRIFSVEDYGTMNLVSATLMVLVSLGKLGVQHSIVRYASEIQTGRRPYTMRAFYSTALFGMIGSSVLVAALWLIVVHALPPGWLNDPRLPFLFVMTSGVIVAQVVESALVNFLRAEQKSGLQSWYLVIKRWAGLGLIVAVLLLLARDLRHFYAATLTSEVVAVTALGFVLFSGKSERPRPAPSAFSRPLFGELLSFGIPMMIGYEIAGIILGVGDRYFVQGLMGGEALGIYAAAYNLCQYLQTAFIQAVSQAVVPLYMRIWSEDGAAATQRFVSQALGLYARFGAAIVAGMAAVGPVLLPFVASAKYGAGALIIPWVVAGMVVDGASVLSGAGLFIQRRTTVVCSLVLANTILNLALNVVLVPRMGILGAALATLVAYVSLGTGMAIAGAGALRIVIPWAVLVRSIVLASAMYLAVSPLHLDGAVGTLVLRVAAGVIVYGALLAIFDREAREMARRGLPDLERWWRS